MKCTCGHRRFANRREASTAEVSRWMLTADEELEGFGATPFGTGFGAADSGGSYGRYVSSLRTALLYTYCESCKRLRAVKQLGGIVALGSYVEGNTLFVVASDIVRPVTCFDASFVAPDGTSYVVALQLESATPPPIFGEPIEFAESLPVGAVVASSVLSAVLPEVLESGDYLVQIVDRCSGNTTDLVQLFLEASVQVLLPRDADLGGAPVLWLRGFNVNIASATQPAGASVETIPFDKCTGVLEYNAALGDLPDAQGWSLEGVGSIGDFSIVDGRAMGFTTTTISYFEKALTLGANPGRVHGYIKFLRSSFGSSLGLDLQALYATNTAAWRGARVASRDAGIYKVELDDGGAVALDIKGRPAGWEEMGGSQVTAGPGVAWRDDYTEDATATYGTVGTAGATEIRARFGRTSGDGPTLTGYIRNVVVSAPGRFIRAGFSAYAETSTPVLRLYLSRLSDADTDRTARFRLIYGQGLNPYAAESNTADFTATLAAANNLYEFPVSLLGLEAKKPFWFTVERLWSHGDDLFDSTVHLHRITVRAQ